MTPPPHPHHSQILLRLLDPPVRRKGELDKSKLAVDDWERRLVRRIEEIAEDTDYFETDYPDPADDVRGHPFLNNRTFFDLNPRERLDVLYCLSEERLDDDPEGECGAEVRAMAVHNNTAEAEEEGTHHPEAHGDPIGSDSDNRQYFACVGDLRVYRWEKPKANAFAQPAWGTVCVGLKETMAFADSLKGGKRNSKDYLLWEYLTETHLPPHLAAVEREERAARATQKAIEDAEKRRLDDERFNAVDRKRSGRIAQKAAEEESRRRIEEEAAAKREAVRAAAAEKEAARQRACWRWMLLPARLRPSEVPEGMNPLNSDAAAHDADQIIAARASANPAGDECVGKSLDIYWEDDNKWYRGVVKGYDGKKNHDVYYPEDDVTETVRLSAVRKRWIPLGYEQTEGAPPPPEVFEPGLEHRGVKMDGRDTVLFMRRPKGVGEDDDFEVKVSVAPNSSDRSSSDVEQSNRDEEKDEDDDGYGGIDEDEEENDSYWSGYEETEPPRCAEYSMTDATVGNAGEPRGEPVAKKPRSESGSPTPAWYPQGVPGDLVPQGAKKPEPKPYSKPEPEPELTAEPEPEPEPELTAEEPAERSEKQKEIFARMRAAGAEKRRFKEETRLRKIANLERIRAAKRAAKEEEQAAAAPMDAAEPEV